MARRLALVGGACLLAGVGGPAVPASADAVAWESFSVGANAAAIRVIAQEPGGPLAGTNDRVADLTAFAAEAVTDELSSAARAVAAFHGNDGLIPAVRGIAPSKLDSALAPTPLGGLPVDPPAALPLEASSSYPARPQDAAVAATARSAASSGPSYATASVVSNEAAGVVRSTATSTVAADGALVATASTTVEGAGFGSVRIGRVASAVTVRQLPGERVRRETVLEVAGLSVGGESLAIGDATDKTLQGVRVRVLAAESDETGTTAPVLEVSLTVPQSLAGSGDTHAVYRFGAAAARVAGVAETSRDTTEANVFDPVPALGDSAFDLGTSVRDAAPNEVGFVAAGDGDSVADAASSPRRVTRAHANSSVAPVAIVAAAALGCAAVGAVRWRRRRAAVE